MAAIAAPVSPNTITEPIVPFSEAGGMVAKLIASWSDVPRFGDQLHARENGILAKRIVETGAWIEAMLIPPERRAEIEAESIDMERGRHQVAQESITIWRTFGCEIQRVAGAGIIGPGGVGSQRSSR